MKAKNNGYINKLFQKMTFNFKGYFENSGFSLDINSEIKIEDFKYILFSSKESQKKIFKYYKEELQQGGPIKSENYGKFFIALTGFYDKFPKRPSWENFKTVISPIVLYTYEIDNNGRILLTPLNVNKNNEIFSTMRDKILAI